MSDQFAVRRRRDGMYLDLKKMPKVRFSKTPVCVTSAKEANRHVWYDGLYVERVPVNGGPVPSKGPLIFAHPRSLDDWMREATAGLVVVEEEEGCPF